MDQGGQLYGRVVDLLAGTEFQAGVLSGLLILAFSLFGRVFAARPKVVWGPTHQFCFGLPITPGTGSNGLCFTRTVLLTNAGTAPTDWVEVYFTAIPGHLQVWPPCNHSLESKNGHILTIPNLGPKETVAIEMLQVENALPEVIRVRSKHGEWPQVPVAPMRVFPAWVNRAVVLLMFFGAFAVLKWAISAALYVWLAVAP